MPCSNPNTHPLPLTIPLLRGILQPWLLQLPSTTAQLLCLTRSPCSSPTLCVCQSCRAALPRADNCSALSAIPP